jgi:hypothetical protein
MAISSWVFYARLAMPRFRGSRMERYVRFEKNWRYSQLRDWRQRSTSGMHGSNLPASPGSCSGIRFPPLGVLYVWLGFGTAFQIRVTAFLRSVKPLNRVRPGRPFHTAISMA